VACSIIKLGLLAELTSTTRFFTVSAIKHLWQDTQASRVRVHAAGYAAERGILKSSDGLIFASA
jgi:hypothetical protein